MCAYDGAGALGCAVAAVEELPRGLEDRVDALEQLAVGDLAAEVPPEHLDRVQPRAVGRQVEEDEPARGAAQHGLDLLVLVGAGVVPGDVDGPTGVPGQELLQKLGHLAPPLAPARDDDSLAAVPVDRAQAVAPGWLRGGGDHHLPPDEAPHGPDRRVPADVELVGVVEGLARLQAATGRFDRPFFSAYSGSGLVMVCCGRLRRIPPSRSRRQTLAPLTRIPVSSAKWSARRAAVHSENGRPSARGRRRRTPSSRSRNPAG